MFPSQERERYREPVRQALTALLALGWTVEYGEADTLSPKGSIRRSSSRQDVVSAEQLLTPSGLSLGVSAQSRVIKCVCYGRNKQSRL